MVGVTKIGPRSANYWINAVAEGGEDYYTKPGEAPGEWIGKLASDLGLEGEVEPDAYAALLAGEHPGTAEALVDRPGARRYANADGSTARREPILGYDIRFSAPKSVSLLHAVGSAQVRAAILRAHEDAVRQAITYMERHACLVQRGHGGKKIERGQGFVAMAFRHRSSRAGDPALHTHVVTANMTRALSDGRWLSLANPREASPLLREAKAAGHVYQAALRANVTRELGLAWREPHNGYADLEGIGRAVIEHFSRRRAEILAEMAAHGTESAAAAEVAAYRTREAKDYGVDPDTQRAEWVSRAAEFGLTAKAIDLMVERVARREPERLDSAVLDGALADLEQHHSHFDRRELIQAIANRLAEGADARVLERAANRLIRSDRVLVIHEADSLLGYTYYTTPRLWELEQRFMATARAGERAGAALIDAATLSAVLERNSHLAGEQREMVRRLTTGGERIVAVSALPGAGKTTALAVAREAWAQAGIRGIGLATARSASGELGESAGMPATSITAFLIRVGERIERGLEPLRPGTVIVVDEASTAPTPHLAALADLVEHCDGKLVLVGDPRQIGAVGPGGLYGRVASEIEPIVLTEIRRQRDPIDRYMVKLAHEGRGSDALDVLAMRERLVVADTLPEALEAQALDWHRRFAAGEDTVMIARRTRDVAELNDLGRRLLRATGRVGEEALVLAGREFALGDRVITRVNTATVSNRERWDVVGVDRARQELRLRGLGGQERGVVLGRAYLDRRTEAGEPALQHAYALTTYTTQSKTFDSTFALLDAGISSEDFLVAISRARGPVSAYGVASTELIDPDLGPAEREIADAAHELRLGAERTAGEYAAGEVALRTELKLRSPEELAEARAELVRRLEAAATPSPAHKRLERLEARLATLRSRLEELSARRASLEREPGPDAAALSRLQTNERLAREQLGDFEADRGRLVEEIAREPKRVALTPAERGELAAIEDRLAVLRRREIAEERLSPSEVVERSLGARPRDPEKAALWNEGVETIHAYRQRYGITARSGHPLGPPSRDAVRSAERRQAELRLERVQRRLGREQARDLDRGMEIER